MTLQTYIHIIADPNMCPSYNRDNTMCGGRLFVIHFILMVGVLKERRTLIGPW